MKEELKKNSKKGGKKGRGKKSGNNSVGSKLLPPESSLQEYEERQAQNQGDQTVARKAKVRWCDVRVTLMDAR